MSSIQLNDTNGLLHEPVKKLRSNIDISMLAYAGAILVPIAVPKVLRKHAELNSNTFFLSTNSVMLCIPLKTMVGRLRSNRKSLCAQRPISCVMLGHNDTTSASVEHYGVQPTGCMDNEPEPSRGVSY